MSANTIVSARIDRRVKEEASAVLAQTGLTVADVLKILLVRTAREKALPFEPLVPNETTITAMHEARAGKLESVTLDDIASLAYGSPAQPTCQPK
jgi:DNA-damage-inducible protein J